MSLNLFPQLSNAIELTPDSPFGQLLIELIKSFEINEKESGSNSIFSSLPVQYLEIRNAHLPKNWLSFGTELAGNQKIRFIKTKFCIESALVTLGYLILLHFSKDLIKNQSEIDDPNDSNSWAMRIQELNNLFFSQNSDQFLYLWWTEISDKDTTEKLDKILTELYHVFLCFHYPTAEDLLGSLYQYYFDDESRKALGEFYTPKAVADCILNNCGYESNLNVSKLIDPACGSGSFLIEALYRFLQDAEKSVSNLGWVSILDNLLKNRRIVGLDINPFACALARIRFMIELLPYYFNALNENSDFAISKIPIFTADALQIDSQVPQYDLDDFYSSFDFVVGNPPYLDVKFLSKAQREYYLGKSSAGKSYETATGRLNLYVLFLERAISPHIGLLRENGKMGLILPTAFMVYSGYGKKIRKMLLSQTSLIRLINLNLCASQIFSQDISTQIMILKRGVPPNDYSLLSTILKRSATLETLTSLTTTAEDAIEYCQDWIPIKWILKNPFLSREEMIISPLYFPKYCEILSKIIENSQNLGDLTQIIQGIRIGSSEKRKRVLINENQFLKLNDEQQRHWRKIIDARELFPYQIVWKKRYLKYYGEEDSERLYLPNNLPALLEREQFLKHSVLFFRNTAPQIICGGDFKSENTDTTNFFPLNTLYFVFKSSLPSTGINQFSIQVLSETDFLKVLMAILNSPIAEFFYRINFWGLAIPNGNLKYREIMKYIPIRMKGNDSSFLDLLLRLIAMVDSFMISFDPQLLEMINDLIFELYGINSEKETILQFLNEFCPKAKY